MHLIRMLFMTIGLCCSAHSQAGFAFLEGTSLGSACCLTVDSTGNTYIARGGAAGVVVLKLDQNFRPVFRFRAPGSWIPKAIATDALGGVVLAGLTLDGERFPLVSPPAGLTPGARYGGFVAKLDPQGTQLAFSAVLGGSDPYLTTEVDALTLDKDGSIYLTGGTQAPDFPVTPNAYQRSGPTSNSRGTATYAFLTKLTASGSRVVYSTFYGDSVSNCGPGSLCEGVFGVTAGLTLAAVGDGSVILAGVTTAINLPVTGGAFQKVCHCGLLGVGNGFIARFRPDGSTLDWATFLGGSGSGSYDGDIIRALVLTSDGGVVVAGDTNSSDFPVTPGVFQPKPKVHATNIGPPTSAFVTRFNSTGSALVYSTYLGGSVHEQLASLQVDAAGNPWLVGATNSPDFPLTPGGLNLGISGQYFADSGDFVAELSADATLLIQSSQFPPGTVGTALALDAANRQTLLGFTGSILRIPAGLPPAAMMFGLANSAGYSLSGKVAPGELISLYGIGLGPAQSITAGFNINGKLATQLGGTQVLFDGVPAPLLYASDRQVNAVVPFGVAGKASTSVQVRNAAGATVDLTPSVVAADPWIFASGTATPPAAIAINEDGTLNSASNPAALGSIVAVWVSGCGGFQPPEPDGAIIEAPLPGLALPISATVDQTAATVVYAGASPEQVAGLAQVNIRIPQNLPGSAAHTLTIGAGGFVSPAVAISIR